MKNTGLLLAILVIGSQSVSADEGMWPYNIVPKEDIQRRYGFELTDAWLDHARAASVRFNNGGSGSLVSSSGLVMTNHHVGADCIQKLSQGDDDLMKNGFVAASLDDERKCPDLELNQLTAIEDVTPAISAAMDKDPKADEESRNKARKAEMSKLEKACAETSGLRCDVVTLYSGGAYHLYKYKKYTDVRLVFAPEFDAAFFGGDPENFTYPRTCLDAAFFRIYEGDAPVTSEKHLAFSKIGAQDGELVFVSGNPGSTDRFSSVSELTLLRDDVYPFLLDFLRGQRDFLAAYRRLGEAQDRAARDDFFGVENAIKAITGYHEGLLDPKLMAKADQREKALQEKVNALNDKTAKRLLGGWQKLTEAHASSKDIYKSHAVFERYYGRAFGTLASIARHLLRLSVEQTKDNSVRMREYRDSNLASLKHMLFSEAPIDTGLEVEKMAFGLARLADALGADNPVVKKVLAGKTPAERAREIVEGTRLKDVAVRQQLHEGGAAALAKAGDPMIDFARALDEEARKVRTRYEADVEARERIGGALVAEAWAKAYGESVYPDATFTLRLNHGVVKGIGKAYSKEGTDIRWRTQLGDFYRKSARADGKAPYVLPERWAAAKTNVDFTTPMNFVSTNDIIGGNSGSPVFNADLEIVGLVFDGNLAMLPNRFVYRESAGRAVSVHSAVILHALDRIYGAKRVHDELVKAGPSS